MTRFMASRKNKSDIVLESYMRFLRMCKLLLTDTSRPFEISDIPEDNEFYKDALEVAKMNKVDLRHATVHQSDTIMLDMLYNAWNDINVGGSIDINVKFNVSNGRKDTKA